MHAACAKVAHLSGAREYIDTVDRDIDTTRVLARDGSSARVLVDAMTRIAIHLNFEPEMSKPDKGIYCIKLK